MKSFKLNIIVCVCLLLSSKGGYAQDFKEDYKKVFKTYLSSSQISVDISYAVYPDQFSQVAVQKEGGCFWMDGKKHYQKYMETENLESSPYHLYIDHKRKIIVLSEESPHFQKIEQKEAKKMGSSFALSLIDSSLPNMKNVEFKGEKEGIREYRLIPKTGQKEIGISINTKTWLLSRIIIFSNSSVSSKGKTLSKPRAEITYLNVNLHPRFKQKDFSISKYGEFIKGKFQLNSQYKGYKLDYKKT